HRTSRRCGRNLSGPVAEPTPRRCRCGRLRCVWRHHGRGEAARDRGTGMDRPSWAPEGVDMQQPSPARMYDALLGGSHNFAVDRMAAETGTKLVPDLPRLALSNRAFLRRAVRFMLDSG